MVFYDDIITFFYLHEFQHVSVVIRSSYKDAITLDIAIKLICITKKKNFKLDEKIASNFSLSYL